MADGTTDVTRTLHFGMPTDEQRKAYTRVLIGSIQLSSLIFPSHLTTDQLDAVARTPLWSACYDYMHGTGHGIGYFSSVHECLYSTVSHKIVASRELWNTIDESHSSGTIRVAAPISVSYFANNSSVIGCSIKLKPGFFLSNEPGYYKEGDFGVRLENILEVIPADKSVCT